MIWARSNRPEATSAPRLPHLSSVGSGTMVSDGLNIMNGDFTSSSFRVTRVRIGGHNFLGNDLTFPPGARVGENCLPATKAMIPIDGPLRSDVGLLGSPAFEIPRSVQRDAQFDELKIEEAKNRLLPAKNRHNILTMGLFLAVRWFQLFAATISGAVAVSLYGFLGVLAVALATLAFLVFNVLLAVVVERSVLGFGRLKPQYCSIYDPYFWHHERLWKLLAPAPFSGTPFKPMIWRMLGVRVGKRLYDAGVDVPEKTLVTIGDDCALNEGTAIQSHSLEDDTFKSDHIVLGNRCSLGVTAFVHYGVTMHDGTTLKADSFLMKGEDVPEGAIFARNPAREVPDPARRVPTIMTGGPRHRASDRTVRSQQILEWHPQESSGQGAETTRIGTDRVLDEGDHSCSGIVRVLERLGPALVLQLCQMCAPRRGKGCDFGPVAAQPGFRRSDDRRCPVSGCYRTVCPRCSSRFRSPYPVTSLSLQTARTVVKSRTSRPPPAYSRANEKSLLDIVCGLKVWKSHVVT